MTLNTFHFAGVSAKSQVVRGVPRIKELINITKKIKSPSLTIYLKNEFATDKKLASNILTELETTNIKNIIKFCADNNSDYFFIFLSTLFDNLDMCLNFHLIYNNF